MRHCLILTVLGPTLLAGCYWEPQRAEILVSTTPPGASCLLSQLGQPIATVEPTPAIALVGTVAPEITVQCHRPGFAQAAVTLPMSGPGPLPGYIPSRRHEIDVRQRVDIALAPLPR